MASTNQSCNHVIAVIYKIDYALQKDLLNPSCTSTSCSWNKSAKRDIEPKKIKDTVIRKKIRLRSNIEELDTYKEKGRSEELQNFNQVLQSFRKLKDEEVSKFYSNLHDVSSQSAVLLCIHSEEETELEALPLENIASKMDNISKDLTQYEHISKFLESLLLSKKSSEILEIKTRGPSDNDLWSAERKGCLTTSNHHGIFTKMNRVIKITSITKPKTTPLLNKILSTNDITYLEPIKWGKLNEAVALNELLIKETTKHRNFKVNKCGLFLDHKKPYIGASADAVACWKCHGFCVVEIKCPFNIRDKLMLVNAAFYS